MRFKLFFYSVSIFWLINACTKDKGRAPVQPLLPPVTPTITTTPTNTIVTGDSCKTNIKYSVHISKIISNSCAIPTCHVATGYKDFSTYALLKGQFDALGKSYFISRIKPGGGMPPSYSTGAKLSSCDMERLEEWLKNDAPNN